MEEIEVTVKGTYTQHNSLNTKYDKRLALFYHGGQSV